MPTLYSKEKTKTWRLCSEYIRKRDCLKTTGTFEHGTCCTCGVMKPYKLLDAGHFFEGRHNSILFDVRNIHAQCKGCNGFLEGNRNQYIKFMLREYGQDTIDLLEDLNKKQVQYKIHHFKDMQSNFKRMIKELEDEKP